MKKKGMGITLLGLGPGNPELLTREAWSWLHSISEIFLLTAHHLTVGEFPKTIEIHNFDEMINQEVDYKSAHKQIVQSIMELGRRPEGVTYGVPGHPLFTETTCPEIIMKSKTEGLPVRLIEGVSLFDSTFSAIGQQVKPYVTIVEALDLETKYHPLFPPNFPVWITQIHSKDLLKQVKETLLVVYPSNHPIQLIHTKGISPQNIEHLLLDQIDQCKEVGFFTTLFLPPLGINTSFEEFQELIAHLRSPGGCPWDREQTHKSLRRNLLEETYETLEAIDQDDVELMQEEFGDLLLQIVLHAQIASESGEFTMADVIKGIYSKLVHRHPHVFGKIDLKDAQLVIENWERLKALERGENEKKEQGLLDGISLSMPALAVAEAYQRRVARVGFDWSEIHGVVDKIREEIEEFREADKDEARIEEIGDILFAMANLARWVGVDPEAALRNANEQFRKRFSVIEAEAKRKGVQLSDMTLEEMNKIWEIAKKKY